MTSKRKRYFTKKLSWPFLIGTREVTVVYSTNHRQFVANDRWVFIPSCLSFHLIMQHNHLQCPCLPNETFDFCPVASSRRYELCFKRTCICKATMMHSNLKPAKTCSDSSADNEAWNHKQIQNQTEFQLVNERSSIFRSTTSEIGRKKKKITERIQTRPENLNYAPPSQSKTMTG